MIRYHFRKYFRLWKWIYFLEGTQTTLFLISLSWEMKTERLLLKEFFFKYPGILNALGLIWKHLLLHITSRFVFNNLAGLMREYFFLSGSNLTMFLLSIYSLTVWWVRDKSNQRTEQMLASQNGFSALQIWEPLLNFVISIYPENWVRIMFGIVFHLNTSHEQLSDQERY